MANLIADYASKDWLGKFPEQFFRTQDGLRDEKAQRHAFSWAVYRGEPRAEAGHFEVAEIHQYKDLITRQALSVAGGLITVRNLPDEARSFSVLPDNPDDETDVIKAEVVEAAFRDKSKDLLSDLIQYTIDSMVGFGGVCIVGVDSEYDDDGQGERVCFKRRWLDFGDFVLDRGAPKASMSPLGRRIRYSRSQLMELSEPVEIEGGELEREAVFDREAVEMLFRDNEEGVMQAGNSYMENVKDEADNGSGDTNSKDWYDCFEYVGDVVKDGKVLAKKQIITSCAGICLRAGDDPDQECSWVLFGSEDGQLGDPYPESKGYLVAMKETNTNLYGTWMAHARATETFGMLTFDATKAAFVEKWGDSYHLGPRKQVPDIFEKFDYTADSSSFKEIREENNRTVLQLVGISDAALVGAPVPNVSATAAAGYQAMAETRISLDAKHYYPIFEKLLQIHYRLLLENWDVEVVTLENGKRYMITKEDLGDFKGQMVLTTAGNVSPSPVKLQNWERARPVFEAAKASGMLNELEYLKASAETYGFDQSMINKLIREPPPPPAPAMPQGGQGPMMAGPPVDNVVPMPGMAVAG